LLAMGVNDNACCLEACVAFKFIVGTPPGASSLLQGRDKVPGPALRSLS